MCFVKENPVYGCDPEEEPLGTAADKLQYSLNNKSNHLFK